MKYEHIILQKTSKSGWEQTTSAPFFSFPAAKDSPNGFETRHSYVQGLGWSGNYGVESVTQIHRGGFRKDTESLDFFFDYTYAPDAMHSVRYREGIRRTK